MACASAGPIPGSACNSSALAELSSNAPGMGTGVERTGETGRAATITRGLRWARTAAAQEKSTTA